MWAGLQQFLASYAIMKLELWLLKLNGKDSAGIKMAHCPDCSAKNKMRMWHRQQCGQGSWRSLKMTTMIMRSETNSGNSCTDFRWSHFIFYKKCPMVIAPFMRLLERAIFICTLFYSWIFGLRQNTSRRAENETLATTFTAFPKNHHHCLCLRFWKRNSCGGS